MDAIFLSSGDVIADRRFEWARDLAAKGDLAAAADLLTQVLELSPRYAAAWFALGDAREKLGDRDGAIAAFEQAKAADPADAHGATLRLARLGGTAVAMPEDYVRTLFDGYASGFDAALTKGLSYRAPELLLRAVQTATPATKFSVALDLGCGTGLGGAAFRPFCGTLAGVDLSPAMLAQARAKNIYDRLAEAEVLAFLMTEATAAYDLVLAADVFMYLDDLGPVLKAVVAAAAPGGIVAFSVETHEGNGVTFRDTLRYAHGAAHVRAALEAAGLTLVSLDSASTRTEKGVPVPGLIVVARAPSS
jgi:predicted TPR repeat methyltransferase